MKMPMKVPNQIKKDQWFLEPRASNEIELTERHFKAFGRIVIVKTALEVEDDTEDIRDSSS